MNRTVKSEPTIRYDIYMAGDYAQAKQICRGFCLDVGLCVHIEPVDYIYTGGMESGFKIGLINYPRFPVTKAKLYATASLLAEDLMTKLHQQSFCIIGADTTTWHSRRPVDLT